VQDASHDRPCPKKKPGQPYADLGRREQRGDMDKGPVKIGERRELIGVSTFGEEEIRAGRSRREQSQG